MGSHETNAVMGSWKLNTDTGGFDFLFNDGTKPCNTVIYIDVVDPYWGLGTGYYGFDEHGNTLKGWANVNGYWYYFDRNGQVMTGLLTIDGVEYYLNPGIYEAGGLAAPVGALLNLPAPIGV